LRKSTWPLTSVLAAGLLTSTLVPGVADATSPPPVSLNSSTRIHPLLQYGLQADPTKLVRVIVQLTKSDVKLDSITSRVPDLQVNEQFGVIPAFVATVPQSTVSVLAALPNVRYVSPDGAVQVIPSSQLPSHTKSPKPHPPKSVPQSKHGIDFGDLVTSYPFATGATAAWSGSDGHVETGSNVAVAVIDSGIDAGHPDLGGQVLAVNVNRDTRSAADGYGHGTHVAGIIDGHDPARRYLGIAPNATLISVKVADDDGGAYESDLLRGLDWVYLNADAYKIRALNLSVSVAVPESYATSPVDAAVENLWFHGVTVVASAGNLGADQDAVWYAPGNDPLVITVGCLDDNGTASPDDDSLCPISSRGITEDGFAKPDLVAPGRKILSVLSSGIGNQRSTLATEFPERVTSDGHIRLSGTSMAAPMVTGAVALLLERNDHLTPSQLKVMLTSTAHVYPGQTDQAGALDIAAALAAADHPPANRPNVPLPVGGAVPPHDSVTLLWDGARWGNAFFDGARWGGSFWDGARWGSAEWDGARWGSAYWDGARWGSAFWDGARWGSSSWDGARWGSSSWDGARWGSSSWDGARWGSSSWDGARWGNGKWD
jgi:serine protease AprX